jgi:hypothetical protein
MPASFINRGNGRDRFYPYQGEYFVSVTTVLDRLPKPALDIWKQRRLLEGAMEHWEAIKDLTPAKAIAYITKQQESSSNSADIGNIAHKYLETRERPEDLPAEAVPFLDRIDEFLVEYRPEVWASERTVYSRQYGYAGTTDIIMDIGGIRYFADLKTGKSVWSEVGLQLAAYRHADFMLVDGKEFPISEVGANSERGIVLHVRPDRVAEPRTVKIGHSIHQSFLSILDVYNWEQDSEGVIGNILPIYE